MSTARRLLAQPWWLLVLHATIVTLIVILLLEFMLAAFSSACSDNQAGPNCYPLSGESPAGDFWIYRSKQFYLVSLVAQVAILIAAMSSMLIARRTTTGAAIAVVLSVLALALPFA